MNSMACLLQGTACRTPPLTQRNRPGCLLPYQVGGLEVAVEDGWVAGVQIQLHAAQES